MDRLLDYVSLSPTRHKIDVEDVQRKWIDVAGRRSEVFVRVHAPHQHGARLMILKLVGAGGRAENATAHPLEQWPDLNADVWSINPPGYGNSEGRASLAKMVPAALALYDHATRDGQGGRKAATDVLLIGTSLGAATAIAVAAQRPVSAVLARDPPQIAQVIKKRFGWRTFGLAHAAARKVPRSLDTIDAARKCQSPALFITSGRDRIVPIACQREVINAYRGETRVVHFPEADHGEPPPKRDLPPYFDGLNWLRSRLGL